MKLPSAHSSSALRTHLDRAGKLRLVIPLIIALGIAYRLALPPCYSLAGDEFNTVRVLQETPRELVKNNILNNPPLFYLLVKASAAIFGESDFTLRLPSLLSGCTSLILFALIMRRLADERVSAVAVGLAAVNPCLAWYSIQARSMSLSAFFLLLVVWLVLRAGKESGWGLALWLGLLSFLAMFTHYASGLCLVGLSAALTLALTPCLFRRWLLCQIGAGICFLPWVFLFLSESEGAITSYSQYDSLADLLPEIAKTPYMYVLFITLVTHKTSLAVVATVGCLLLVALGLPITRLARDALVNSDPRRVALLCWFVVPLLVLILLIPVVRIFDPKYAIGASYGLFATVAVGAFSLRKGYRLGTLGILAALQLAATGIVVSGHAGWTNWYPVVRALEGPEYSDMMLVFPGEKWKRRFEYYSTEHGRTVLALHKTPTGHALPEALLDQAEHPRPHRLVFVIQDVSHQRKKNPGYLSALTAEGYVERDRRQIGRTILLFLEKSETKQTRTDIMRVAP